jgi:hypothetical protein
MARTITLRLSDEAYEAVRRYAEADQQSMDRWVESVLDAEDMRRRCAAHDAWVAANPPVARLAERLARQRHRLLTGLLTGDQGPAE